MFMMRLSGKQYNRRMAEFYKNSYMLPQAARQNNIKCKKVAVS